MAVDVCDYRMTSGSRRGLSVRPTIRTFNHGWNKRPAVACIGQRWFASTFPKSQRLPRFLGGASAFDHARK